MGRLSLKSYSQNKRLDSYIECFGEFRTGKTQIAHTICVTAQMPGPGHNGGKVAYIDTENTFRPNRIRPIAERFDLDPDLVLGNIGYGWPDNNLSQNSTIRMTHRLWAIVGHH